MDVEMMKGTLEEFFPQLYTHFPISPLPPAINNMSINT